MKEKYSVVETLEIVIGMRKSMFAFLALFLLATLVSLQKVDIPDVKASLDIYQGDLILTDNNVTVIEGRFDINGSIFVEDNATLVLKNAILNFTQEEYFQFTMIFRNPANGNPRLQVENATIASSGYALEIDLYGNSSASVSNLTAPTVYLYGYGSSVMAISNSTILRVGGMYSAVVSLSNCDLLFAVEARDDSSFSIFNCTLQILQAYSSRIDVLNSTIKDYVALVTFPANCTVDGLEPGFFDYWDFQQNCSVLTAPGGWASNLTLTDTQVEGWGFEIYEDSNVTISNSELQRIYAPDFSDVSVYNSAIMSLKAFVSSRFWLVNSTSNLYDIRDQSEVYICWYLDVHVIDSIGQDVPSASVTATYPNATIAESKLTNAIGWARLTLMEKKMNATGEYVIGNYVVEATYESHSNSTETGMMTENKQITLALKDFVIPEFPSLLILPLFILATLSAAIVCKRKRTI